MPLGKSFSPFVLQFSILEHGANNTVLPYRAGVKIRTIKMGRCSAVVMVGGPDKYHKQTEGKQKPAEKGDNWDWLLPQDRVRPSVSMSPSGSRLMCFEECAIKCVSKSKPQTALF